mgnify:CR=1 FL=1
MATITVLTKIDPGRLPGSIRDIAAKLDGAGDGLLLDFSSVQRVDAAALDALRELAASAAAQSARITLSGVSAPVYKVLKLTGLSPRFSFLN